MRETLLSLDGFAFHGPSSEDTTADSITQATSTLVKDVGYLDSVTTHYVRTATRHGMKATAQDGCDLSPPTYLRAHNSEELQGIPGITGNF